VSIWPQVVTGVFGAVGVAAGTATSFGVQVHERRTQRVAARRQAARALLDVFAFRYAEIVTAVATNDALMLPTGTEARDTWVAHRDALSDLDKTVWHNCATASRAEHVLPTIPESERPRVVPMSPGTVEGVVYQAAVLREACLGLVDLAEVVAEAVPPTFEDALRRLAGDEPARSVT
jgi:hypothetical protein